MNLSNLLRITSTPCQYELNVERAKLQIKQDPIRAEITKTGGELEIEQEGPKVRLDTFEFRSSLGLKNVTTQRDEWTQRAKQDAIAAIGEYAQAGNALVHIEKGANIPDMLFSQYFSRATEGELVMIPLSPTDVSWEIGGAELNYTPVNLNFEWNRPGAQLEYVPGGVSMNILQYPSLTIEYLGGPIYVPPSANPNYHAGA